MLDPINRLHAGPFEGSDVGVSARTASAVMDMLFSRGLDHWWGEIDPDIQIEIVDELEAIVMGFA